MFDTSTLSPMERGRVNKHLTRPVKYDGQYMTQQQCYEALHPVTKIRYRKVTGPAKTGYGLSAESGQFLDCPKMVWECCTLPAAD